MMDIFAPHATDFYKTGHVRQYLDHTEYVYANYTPRACRYAQVLSDFDQKVVNFGTQGCLIQMANLWQRSFFDRPKQEVLQRYKRRMDLGLGKGAVSVEHLGELHDLGYLPLHIKALPEGSRVNLRVPLFTIVNTDPRFYWLTNYIETALSAEVWKMVNNATIAFEYRRLLEHYANLTGAPREFVDWQAHDFSFRGMSGIHDATQCGAAHLTSFLGTDTITALDYLEDFYRGAETFLGGSVPATEHSVMCMGGQVDEVETFRRLIEDLYPKGIVSIVSDTWDFWKVVTDYALQLKPKILARGPDANGNAKVVFRPDSGDPVKILTGYKVGTHPERGDGEVYMARDGEFYLSEDWESNEFLDFWVRANAKPLREEEVAGAVECLWNIFGGTETDLGYRLLDSHVGLIYGDSITLERAEQILERLKAKGFASSNVVFGIGSYTYQYSTRDGFGQAIKATWGVVNGEERELFKDPVTDDGVKRSARGLLRIEQTPGDFVLFDQQTPEQEARGLLRSVFKDGQMLVNDSIEEIRTRLKKSLR